MYLRKSVNMSCDPVSAVSIMTVKQLLTANHSWPLFTFVDGELNTKKYQI